MQIGMNSNYTCRRLFGCLTNSFMVPCAANGSTDIKSVLMQRENTLRNFKSTEHVQLLQYLIRRQAESESQKVSLSH